MDTFAFEWNEEKAFINITKHGVSFEEASTVLSDEYSITIYDEAHSIDEDHYIDIKLSVSNRLLVVVYTERTNHIRIISARQATRSERRLYEQ